MTCNEYQESASAFVDGELDEVETVGLFTHLASCGKCRTALGVMLRVRQSIATIPQPVVQPEVDARVMRIPSRYPHAGSRVRTVTTRLSIRGSPATNGTRPISAISRE